MYRFKLVFDNSQKNNNLGSSLTLPRQPNPIVSRNISLNYYFFANYQILI